MFIISDFWLDLLFAQSDLSFVIILSYGIYVTD